MRAVRGEPCHFRRGAPVPAGATDRSHGCSSPEANETRGTRRAAQTPPRQGRRTLHSTHFRRPCRGGAGYGAEVHGFRLGKPRLHPWLRSRAPFWANCLPAGGVTHPIRGSRAVRGPVGAADPDIRGARRGMANPVYSCPAERWRGHQAAAPGHDSPVCVRVPHRPGCDLLRPCPGWPVVVRQAAGGSNGPAVPVRPVTRSNDGDDQSWRSIGLHGCRATAWATT